MIKLFHLRLTALGLREGLAFKWCLARSRTGFNWASASTIGGGRANPAIDDPQAERRRLWAATLKALKFVLWAIVIVLIAAFFGMWAMYESPKNFESRHLSYARPAVTDRNGDLVGAAPGFRQSGAPADVNDAESRMTALIVEDVPPVWWDVAVALEDRRFGNFGWVYGIDVLGLLGALMHGRGGSTLPMQLVGNLSGDKARQNDNSKKEDAEDKEWDLLLKIKRKLRELASAPSLVAATQANDYLWLKRLAATHLPVMHGRIGGSTVGIASGGWIMFGKTPMELTAGEQAIFAAALKHNILIKEPPDDNVRKIWKKVKDRAKWGLKEAYPEDNQNRIDGTKEIDAMPDTPPLFLKEKLPLNARAHVVHRRIATAQTVVGEAQAELADYYGLKSLADMPLRGYQLTLDSIGNFDFTREMDQIADALTQELGRECRLFVPLSRNGFGDSLHQRVTKMPRCAPEDLPSTERAHVLAVLANERGEIVRYYQQGSSEPIYAGVSGRSGNDGRYDPALENRDVGSVAKIAIALLLASEGDTATQRYCRKHFQNRLDSDKSTGFESCDAPGAMIEAREAFARSSNLAMLWRLRQLPKGKLTKLAADLGLQLPADVAPAYALAYGQVRAAPRHIHSLMHAIGAIALNRNSRKLGLPHVVRNVYGDEPFRPRKLNDPSVLKRVSAYLATAESRRYVLEVLDAVLTHPRGTLRFLKPYTQAAGWVSAHIGKTGTPVNQHIQAIDKLITGCLVENGRFYSYLLMVRAPRPGKYPLGQRLSAERFAPLLMKLLAQIDTVKTGGPARGKSVLALENAGGQV